MTIHFLGTNGWFTTKTGNTSCTLVDSREGYIIFDAGNGIYQIDQYIKYNKPIFLFLSHFHLDHVEGLHILSKFNFKQGIDIYIVSGRKKDFDTLVGAPYTSVPQGLIRLHELTEGKQNIGFSVEVVKMKHAFEDHGFRVTLEDKTMAYSGDTGICPNSKLLAKNADLLIHECSFIRISEKETWGHADPMLAATIAKEAGVKKLVLTHFDASQYTNLEKRKWAEKEARKIFTNTIAATDDFSLQL